MRQGDLARALGISAQQLHKYEQGQDRISAGRLFRIAEALDIGVDYFFAQEPAATPVLSDAGHAVSTPPRSVHGLAAEFIRQFGNIDDPHVQQAIDTLIRALARTGTTGSLLISILP